MKYEQPADAIYRVAVRELCEFAAKTGDLDHRFTPSPSAQEGIAGHQLVTARWASQGGRRQFGDRCCVH